MLQGEIVIVKAFMGKPLVRRIWGVGERVVYITNDEQFKLLMNKDQNAIGPIGFPKKDVFRYDHKIAKYINNKHGFDWSGLTLLSYEDEKQSGR